MLNTSGLSAGQHVITVSAADSFSTPYVGAKSVTINLPSVPPLVRIDSPVAGATISGQVSITGWAIDNASAVGTAIGSVQVRVDGNVVGTATYGSARPGVCSAFPGRPGCPNVGYAFTLNSATLSTGVHTITVTATDTDSSPDSGSASITVTK